MRSRRSAKELVGSLARRVPWPRRRESALVLIVPEAEPAIGRWRAQFDPAAANGMPAHVTLLYPFVPPPRIDAGVETALEELVAGFSPFRFALASIGRFPGVLYLAPEPAGPFIDLVRAIERRWPEHPPYGGAFEAVVPHLTLAQGEEPPDVAELLEKTLPIEARAEELALMVQGADRLWSERRRFALGADS